MHGLCSQGDHPDRERDHLPNGGGTADPPIHGDGSLYGAENRAGPGVQDGAADGESTRLSTLPALLLPNSPALLPAGLRPLPIPMLVPPRLLGRIFTGPYYEAQARASDSKPSLALFYVARFQRKGTAFDNCDVTDLPVEHPFPKKCWCRFPFTTFARTRGNCVSLPRFRLPPSGIAKLMSRKRL